VFVRVLIIDGSDRGGILRYTRHLVAALEREEVHVQFVTGADSSSGLDAYPAAKWGAELRDMGTVHRKVSRLASTFRRGVALAKVLRATKPDIVHVQTSLAFRADTLLAPLIRRKAKLIITIHDAEPLEGSAKERAVEARRWRTADALIVHSERAASKVREVVESDRPVAVVPVDQLVEFTGVSAADARRRLGLGSQRIVLLIGIVRSYKGLRLLGEMWPLLRAQDPVAELHIVGEISEQSEDLVRLADMDGVFVHDGWLPEESFDFWASAADVCVLPYERGVHSGVLHRVVANRTHVLVSPSLGEEAERYEGIPVVELVPEAWVQAVLACRDAPLPLPPEPGLMARETIKFYTSVWN
jgi:glycosyltransferase involved in cell wall biosynthesis